MILLWLFLTFLSAAFTIDSRFKGCYKTIVTQTLSLANTVKLEQCIEDCRLNYYRYSQFDRSSCHCVNFLGENVNSSMLCTDFCPECTNLTDIYVTGNLVPGPPQNVHLTNITDRSVHITWEPPKSYTEITVYLIRAVVIHTYANYIQNSPEWTYTNDTFRTRIILLPATKYNISVCAVSPDGIGAFYSEVIETEVGDPENIPAPPKIIKRFDNKFEIKIEETSNSNGPISSYLVIVLKDDSLPIFQKDSLKSYDQAKKEGINYYIAAELEPEQIRKNFIVGDGKYYKGFYNGPLEPQLTYSFMTGIVSRLNGKVKRAFSTGENMIENTKEPEVEENGDSPAVIIGLSLAIGLLSFMLIAGIIGFIILKSRVTTRRHRLSENQELTLQGPMIEVENNGYIPEEEPTKVNHYRNLKQRLRTIPYNQIKMEPNLLGVGRFGKVNSGSIYEDNTILPVAVYSIPDKKLTPDDKKAMLKDLDLLIKTGKHENIISLVGTCETPQMVLVLMEYVSLNLKDLLLGSRDSLPGKFSNLSETQSLDIAINVAKGMSHLHRSKIIHKQLCARNIMIGNGFVAKIGGYGLVQYYSHNNLPDYTRWTAMEVFKGQEHTNKSDIWSFACLLWEICVLGGTPYGNFSNNEIPDRILKGLRLHQLQYFSDELYQLMLDCWQIDPDERPNFDNLIEALEILKQNSLIPCLSFNVYSTFQYEQYYPDMEIAVRPVL